MAGTGVKVVTALLAIPISRIVTSKLDAAWRSTTGTEPPSAIRRKEQIKANKEAEKLGLLPRPLDEPKLADALMWSALSAMSVVTIKYLAERGADEVHRFFTGNNPPENRPATLVEAGAIGVLQGRKTTKESS